MAVRYQKNFLGAYSVPKESEAQSLVQALYSFSSGVSDLGKGLGKKITEQTTAEAEKAARLDGLKSYQEGVDKGTIDKTKSNFWISVYDNIKGEMAGVEYNTKKNMAFNEWWADNVDYDDTDGSLFLKWSQDYDSKYLKAHNNQSSYFLKGMSGYFRAANSQLSSKYSKINAEKLKTKGTNNIISLVENHLNEDDPEMALGKINGIDTKNNLVRFVSKQEFNNAVVVGFQNKIAELTVVGDPNADFDKAEQLIDALLDFKRPTGSKYVTGATTEKLNDLKQKILTEKIKHETAMKNVSDNNEVNDWYKQEEKTLTLSLGWDPIKTDDTGAKERADLASDEFKKRAITWLRENRDLSLDEKKTYLMDLRMDIKNKYDGVESTSISIFNSQTKPYNIKRDLVDVQGGIAYLALVRGGTETFEPERVAKWVSIAKLNGYADKDGKINPAELLAFLMDYEAKIRAMGE